jgi:hypothetical protein
LVLGKGVDDYHFWGMNEMRKERMCLHCTLFEFGFLLEILGHWWRRGVVWCGDETVPLTHQTQTKPTHTLPKRVDSASIRQPTEAMEKALECGVKTQYSPREIHAPQL